MPDSSLITVVSGHVCRHVEELFFCVSVSVEVHTVSVCAHVTYLQHMCMLTFCGGYASMHNNYFMLSAKEGFN